MIKAAFFDVDGTLLSFKTHRVPASTERALEAMRERGIKTVISTGRPVYQMPEFLLDGFDAYITLSGQYCFDADGVYRSQPIDDADVRAVVEQVDAGVYDSLCMQGEDSFVNEFSPRVLAAAKNAGLTYRKDDFHKAFDAPVYQFCAFVPPEDDHIVHEVTSNIITTRWCDIFCDIVPAAGGKDFGVRATLERMGIAPEEAIAFGDGENDLSMFGAVGTSVAMGNAWGGTKDAATFVTTDVDHDGVWNACEHFDLI